MATSGSSSVKVTSWDTLKFSWWENSQSIPNNTTTIGWKMELIATSDGRIDSSASKSWSVTVNGTSYSGKNLIGISNNSTKTLASGTTTIAHNSNGTKTFSYSFSQQFSITFAGASIGTKSGTGSGTLDTIPRASSLTASNGTLGTAQTYTVTRADSSFKHRLTYKCGSVSGYVAGSASTYSTATSISWTPPLSLASQNTTGTSVSVALTLTTYASNGTQLGTASKTITCSIPVSVKPTCTIKVEDATEHTATFGNPVQGLSKFKITVTPTLAHGSPISSYKTVVNGVTYTSSSFTTGAITSSGAIAIATTVTDKRGRSGTASDTKTVMKYSAPVVGKMTVGRVNEDGSANDQGEYVRVLFNASVTSLDNKNTATYIIKYREPGGAYTETSLDSYSKQYSITDGVYIFKADTGSSYDIELSVSDKFNTTNKTTSASTAFVLLHWNTEGNGIGIGKIAEKENTMDVGMDAQFRKPVYGKALGMDRLPEIPENSDLNDYKEPGCYAVQRNDVAITCANMPPDVVTAGRLEVWSATGEGVRSQQWSYLRQRYIPYNRADAVWEREISRGQEDIWVYYDWWRTSLTPEASEYVYSECAYEQPICLWGDDRTSGWYMTSGHTANLKQAVSAQRNGIILVFCAYGGDSDTNYGFQSFFVPKQLVALNTQDYTLSHTFNLARGKFTHTGTKYLYIKDKSITGHDDNGLTGTANGITYANNKFVLRYVFGV